jgi:hypothetical protein
MVNQKKIGGYVAIGQETISGPARAQHTWTDLEGRKYAAIGTSKALYIYYEDAFYDITPLATAITSATFTSSSSSSNIVTVNKSITFIGCWRIYYVKFCNSAWTNYNFKWCYNRF